MNPFTVPPVKKPRLAAYALLLLACLPLLQAQRPQDPVVNRQMRDAVAAAQRGDSPQALRLVDALLLQHPGFVPALKLKGLLLEDSGDQSAAAVAYAAALERAPNDSELQLKVGIVALVQGQTDKALDLLRKRVQSAPRDDESFYYLAQAYHRKGDDAQALTAIRRAAQLAPNSAAIAQKYGELLCSSGDSTEGFSQLQRAHRAEPGLPHIQYDLAYASFNNQDFDQALASATKAIADQPNDIEAYALLASTRVKLAQWTEAMPALVHVLAARPDDPGVLLQLGHTQLELKQYQPAIDTLNKSLHADPTQALAHFFLARAYAALGRKEDSLHESQLHARMMQEFSFDVPKAALQHEAEITAKARALLTAGKEQEALQLFLADSQQAHGTQAAAYLGVGATYLRMNDLAASQRTLQQALTLDPAIKGAWTYLGFIALEQDNLALADQDFQAELKGDPNHPEALAEMGEVRYRQARWQEAANYFIKSKTGSPRFLYMLTDAYFHLGNAPAGKLTAESLAAHAHDQPEVLQSLGDLLRRNDQAALAARLVP